VPLDDAGLEELTREIAGEKFGDEKLAVLERSARTHAFPIAAALRLIPLFEWREDRIRAAALLAPWLIERDQASQLLTLFPEPSDRERVRQILSQLK
jgi:hypothetical protein